MKRYIAYYRVSRQAQGIQGLGMAGQKASVEAFAKDGQIVASFSEVESGKKADRPQLEEAIATAKRLNATLIVAKLDRLSRDVRFIFTLRDSGVNFVAADIPEANTLTIGIFAVMAQAEREAISARTKAALAAKKAQGFKLGKPENLTAHILKGSQTRREQAAAATENRQATEVILSAKKEGLSIRAIAAKLNSLNYLTTKGKPFASSSVQELYRRATAE